MAELTIQEVREKLLIHAEIERRRTHNKIRTYFPEKGPLRRELYPKHMEFFRAGREYRERLLLAANRIGKTESVGCYELSLHLTGQYPEWWEGRRFDRPIRAWACGDTGATVREIIQAKLLGPPGAWGTGVIPGDSIKRVVRGAGVADTVSVVYVDHVNGGRPSRGISSQLVLKSYEQGSTSAQGTEQDVILLDEEPPLAYYTECLMRTMTNNGILMLTFTPLLGMSEVVLQLLPTGKLEDAARGTKYVVMATWDDAPHLSKEAKAEYWKSIPPFQREPRSKGIPQLGAGAIYPVSEADFLVDPFAVPDHWPAGYGMDVGWNSTAAVYGRYDRENDVLYLTHGYKSGHTEPAVHVAGIKAPGPWMPGFIDPASRGRNQNDGSQLFNDYRLLGLNLSLADNGVESGIYSVWNRLSTGRMKVFRSMTGWLAEFRLYRRDEKGKVVKENDHYMDATRYLDSRIAMMIPKPTSIPKPQRSRQLVTAWS